MELGKKQLLFFWGDPSIEWEAGLAGKASEYGGNRIGKL